MAENNASKKPLRPQKNQRDLWDKFQAVGGVATAVAVALIGLGGSMFLNHQQNASHKTQLYSQLMSEREKAENAVRKDMFEKILDTFLKQDENSNVCTIDEQLLKLDMLARNFHETLDLQPLFRDVLLHIVRDVNVNNHNANDNELKTFNSKDPCLKIVLLKYKSYFEKNEKEKNEKEKKRYCYKEFLTILQKRQKQKLIEIAKRITNKQLESLNDVSKVFHFTIYLNKTCKEKGPNDIITNDDLCPEDGNVYEHSFPKLGSEQKSSFIFYIHNKKMTRCFTISSDRSYPLWNQVRLKVETKENKSDNCDYNKKPFEFWVSYFDFPLVDNTYLSSDERFAVILDDIDDKKAEVRLLYFPASFAGFKEKAYYQHKIINTLMKDSLNR